MDFGGVLKWLLPKEDHFFGYLEQQAELARQAAEALGRLRSGAAMIEVRDAVQKLEHRADEVVEQMENALARTFVTPLDREDLHHLSSGLDDIVDLTNLVARACALYELKQPTESMLTMMGLLVDCTTRLTTVLPHLRTRSYAKLLESGRALRPSSREARHVLRANLSALFGSNDVDAKELIRQRDILENLERAIDQCDNVAEFLANLAIKNG